MTDWVVIPCSKPKRPGRCKAKDMYTGTMFVMSRKAAERLPGTPLILSAKYGLLTFDTDIDPYDVKMGDPGSVPPSTVAGQARGLGMAAGDVVRVLLPHAYRRLLVEGLYGLGVVVDDLYRHAPGIGYQRGVLARLAKS